MTNVLLSINWGNALIVTLLGFGLVIVLLIVLVFLLMGFSWFFSRNPKNNASTPAPVSTQRSNETSDFLTDDELAAVAIALDQTFFGIHDNEELRLTFSHSDHETDWSSKYSALNQ